MTHCLAANTYVHLMHATITHYVFVRSVSMGVFTELSTVLQSFSERRREYKYNAYRSTYAYRDSVVGRRDDAKTMKKSAQRDANTARWL